jgi:hypothetical protein
MRIYPYLKRAFLQQNRFLDRQMQVLTAISKKGT